MGVIWLLIPLSVLLMLAALKAFAWAIRNRQFDDLDREAARILFEEPRPRAEPSPSARNTARKREREAFDE